ncbi:MAG: efflux RND transporter periplasmic adaptor subunit [Thermoguttaceae bacterium]|nr:efflux RND transporter periplasmic adaptor subunit [Thermoguttaceae bacterium]
MSNLSLIRGTLCGTLLLGACVVAQAQPGMGPASKATVVAEQAGEVYPETTKKYVASVDPIERADLVARVAGTLLARQRAAGQKPVEDGVAGLFSGSELVANALQKTLQDMNAAGLLEDLPGVKAAMEDSLARLQASNAAPNETFVEGGLVKAGQKLFSVDKTRYQANVGVAIATVQELVERIKYAKTNFERVSSLYAKNAGSLDDKQKAETELRSVQAQLGLAVSQLKLSVDDLYHSDVYSPIDGRVGRVERTTGNYVKANDALATVVQTNPIYVRFSLSERDFLTMFGGDFGKMKKEAKIALKLSDGSYYKKQGTDEVCYGVVAMRDNVVKTTTDTVKIWATFENPASANGDEPLVPGGVVTVELTRKENEIVPSVKPSAVMFDGESYFVYVLTDEISNDELYEEIKRDARFKAQVEEVENGAKTRDEFFAEFFKRYETKDPKTGEVVSVDFKDGQVVDGADKAGNALDYKMILRRTVVPGPTQGNVQAIYSGVEPGDLVVMDGTHKAKPFEIVRPVEAAFAGSTAPRVDGESADAAETTGEATEAAPAVEAEAVEEASAPQAASSVFSKENFRFLATGAVVAFPILGFAFFRARRRSVKDGEAELE